MKRYIPLILDTLAVVALAAWLGGLSVCWLVLSPTVSATPADTTSLAQTLFAEALRRFGGGVEVCGLVLVALQWVLRRRYQRDQRFFVADGVRTLVLFIALFCAEYGRYVLIPTLIRTQAPAAGSTLAVLALIQAILLVAYAGITRWLQLPRLFIAAPAAPAPGSPQKSTVQVPRTETRRSGK